MSSSAPERRERQCPRCRLHGITVQQRSHWRTCPFRRCDCWRCLLCNSRTEVRAPQQRRPQDQEQRPGAPSSAAPPREAPPSATSPGPAAGGALDLSCRAAREGGRVARHERSEEPPLAPSAFFNRTFPDEMLEPLPQMFPDYYPETLAPRLAFFCTPLYWTPMPPAFFNHGPLGPYLHHPAPGEAGRLACPMMRQFFLNHSTTPPPMYASLSPPPMYGYPSPPPMTSFPSPSPMTSFPSPPPMYVYPSPTPMTSFPSPPPMYVYPSPPPMTPSPSPPPMYVYPSPTPMTPSPSPPPEALLPLLPEDPELNIVEMD